jgi:hypothetical protein
MAFFMTQERHQTPPEGCGRHFLFKDLLVNTLKEVGM